MNDRRVIYISSKNRTSGTSDNFTIEDTQQRFGRKPLSVKAKTINIPYTWYNVVSGPDGNNYFEFIGSISGALNFEVPAGNYTGDTLATELTKQLNIVTAGTTCGGYEVVYNSTTNKFTLTSIAEDFCIDFTVSNNMANILGFDEIKTADAASHTSTNAANILIDTEIWICTNMIFGVDTGVLPWTDNEPKNEQQGILATVPITTCYGGIINYIVPVEFPYYIMTNSPFWNSSGPTRTMTVELRFPSGAPLSLNGNDWSMEIIFDFNRT